MVRRNRLTRTKTDLQDGCCVVPRVKMWGEANRGKQEKRGKSGRQQEPELKKRRNLDSRKVATKFFFQNQVNWNFWGQKNHQFTLGKWNLKCPWNSPQTTCVWSEKRRLFPSLTQEERQLIEKKRSLQGLLPPAGNIEKHSFDKHWKTLEHLILINIEKEQPALINELGGIMWLCWEYWMIWFESFSFQLEIDINLLKRSWKLQWFSFKRHFTTHADRVIVWEACFAKSQIVSKTLFELTNTFTIIWIWCSWCSNQSVTPV